jgi:L-seryl-tRNA(Ser) seleniumtransferase
MHPPSVDSLARQLAASSDLPHPLLVEVARRSITAAGAGAAAAASDEVAAMERTLLQRVVNATGVILHTNLGRAPLAVHRDPTYMNLELDLATGQRGSRHAHAGGLLAKACGAEAAIVVNNCAAAVMLVLAALGRDRDVLVSRGEAVEIGGGFRVPEVMAESGARLVDVGTTNRTRLADYRNGMKGHDVALVLKVHPSNYRVEGFTESTSIAELASLGVPVVADIGSGLLDQNTPWLKGGPPAWVASEMAARQTLEAGASLVTFSGDKLLGGPQAGIIAGRADLVQQCAKHPLARALRAGGLVLASLQDIALAYLRKDVSSIPFWRMASVPVADLRARATAIGVGTVEDMESLPGAGSLPGQTIPSAGLAIPGDHLAALRRANPPIVARVRDDTTYLDLRTVDPADDAHLRSVLGHEVPDTVT